jgi:hypothetical protein
MLPLLSDEGLEGGNCISEHMMGEAGSARGLWERWWGETLAQSCASLAPGGAVHACAFATGCVWDRKECMQRAHCVHTQGLSRVSHAYVGATSQT